MIAVSPPPRRGDEFPSLWRHAPRPCRHGQPGDRSRTVLLRHANWSPINGVRGQTENDVRAVDVSDANDWSAVRVWYAPIQDLGTTHWPVDGFIYNRPARAPTGSRSLGTGATLRLASASAPLPARQTLMAKRPRPQPCASRSGRISSMAWQAKPLGPSRP
jgi:hypothetical protein